MAFSPPPLLTSSSEGIRRYSGFGLFGTYLMPWSEIKAIVADQARHGRQIVIKMAYPPMPRPGKGLIRHITTYPWSADISLSKWIVVGSPDELVSQIMQRYGRELAENGVEVDLDQP